MVGRAGGMATWGLAVSIAALALVSALRVAHGGAGESVEVGRLEIAPSELVVGGLSERSGGEVRPVSESIAFTYVVGADAMGPGDYLELQLPGPTPHEEDVGLSWTFWSRPRPFCPVGRTDCRLDPELVAHPGCEGEAHAAGCTTVEVDGEAVVELGLDRHPLVVPFPVASSYLTATVHSGTLAPGDRLVLRYHGHPQSLAGELTLRAHAIHLDERGVGRAHAIADVTTLHLAPGPAEHLHVVLPARVAPGEPFSLHVAVLDRFANVATGYRGTLTVRTEEGSVDGLPETIELRESDAGVVRLDGLSFAVDTPDELYRIELSDPVLGLTRRSPYTRVVDLPGERIYFGDTHFHTGTGGSAWGGTGGDHRGQYTHEYLDPALLRYPYQSAYVYARDAVAVDFAVASEHDTDPGLEDAVWQQMEAARDAVELPGRFVTFPGYEWTSEKHGHRVVVFADDVEHGAVCQSWQAGCDTPQGLFAGLGASPVDAIAIPHVMNLGTGRALWTVADSPSGALCPAPTADNTLVDDHRQPLAEIYSQHNVTADEDGDGTLTVAEMNDDACRYEIGGERGDDRCSRIGMDEIGRESLRCAWRQGHRIGVIGSSDNHTGRPAVDDLDPRFTQPAGLAAVYATDLSRSALWQGMRRRRTYATSGPRIYLEFSARVGTEGSFRPMGSELVAELGDPLELRATVGGTAPIAVVELIHYDVELDRFESFPLPGSGRDVVRLRRTLSPVSGDGTYYLRVTQQDGEYAWSSPIWITAP